MDDKTMATAYSMWTDSGGITTSGSSSYSEAYRFQHGLYDEWRRTHGYSLYDQQRKAHEYPLQGGVMQPYNPLSYAMLPDKSYNKQVNKLLLLLL